MSDQIDSNVDSSTINEQTTEEVVAPNTSEEVAAEDSVQKEPRLVPLDELIEVRSSNRELKTTIEELNRKIESMAPAAAKPIQDPSLEEAKRQIKELGFVTKEEQEQIAQQAKADAQLEQELTRLESKYTGENGLPKFTRQEVIDYALKNGIADPEAAFKLLKEKDILNYQIQQALTKSKGVKSEVSDGSGSTQSGTTDEDLKQAIRQGDKTALRTYLKRISKS